MKLLFKAALIGALLITSCSITISPVESSPTQLTFYNNSSEDLELVKWKPYNNTTYYFTKDQILDGVNFFGGLKSGHLQTLTVNPGSSYFYFYFVGDVTNYRTITLVTVDKGQTRLFEFNNLTDFTNN